jgi:PKD repeat protein
MKTIISLSCLLLLNSFVVSAQNKELSHRKSFEISNCVPVMKHPLSTYRMDFEQVPDFSLTFDAWKVRDIDSNNTFTITDHTFPHSGQPMAFIAFNPAQVTPAMIDPAIQPHGGQRFGACISASTPSNNDWFISPKIQLATGGSFTFWAKSYTAAYGLEKYKIGVSTTSNNPSAFTIISGTAPLLADTAWTKKSFSLSAYDNQEVYVAIQCVSDTAFIFMIDDLEVKTDTTTSLEADFTASQTTIQPGGSISFSDQSSGYPTLWTWSFPGGTPASSSAKNPAGIVYTLPGTYDVTLIISNGTKSDTLTKYGYIDVTQGGLPSSLLLDFESLPDFSLDFYPWTVKDVNGGITYGIENCTFPHNGSPMAYICFNPSKAVPPPFNMSAHSGDKFGACFSSQPPKNPNNKWLISPKIQPKNNAKIAFWVQSYNIQYGYEKYKVGVSTTGNDPSDFTIISGSKADSAPVEWARKIYSLSAYANQPVYIGIQCVTDNGFCFMVDDIEIGSSVDINDNPEMKSLKIYPNPAKDKIYIDFDDFPFNDAKIEIYNMMGKIAMTFDTGDKSQKPFSADISGLETGLYLVKINDSRRSISVKLIIEK